MSFPAYESYGESGEEWIGLAPAHWAMTPLKNIADFVNGAAFKPAEWGEVGTPIIRIQNLNGGDDFNFYAGEVNPRHHVRSGDLLFGWSGNRGTSFGPFRWDGEGLHYLNQHIFKVEGIRCDKQWLYWCLKGVTEYVEQEAHGIIGMVHVTKGRLTGIKVSLPEQKEQRAIAAFLDRETAKIDALVEAQRRLIELLKEKRQAVISHAVTKGLDPSAPTKDSGVEWLGQVPAHWEVQRFSRAIKIAEGQVDPSIEPYASMVLIAPNHVESGTGRLLATETAQEQGADSGKYQVAAGDVVYSKIRPSLAKAVLAPYDCICSADMYPLRGQRGVVQAYLKWTLLCPAVVAWAVLESDRVAMPKINREKLNELRLPMPPEREQQAIADFLNAQTEAFDALIAGADAAIALLQERRAALISAAVTGKIDVRGLVQTAEAA